MGTVGGRAGVRPLPENWRHLVSGLNLKLPSEAGVLGTLSASLWCFVGSLGGGAWLGDWGLWELAVPILVLSTFSLPEFYHVNQLVSPATPTSRTTLHIFPALLG